MNIIDLGSGTPVVLIPGIQGRWEWMRPAVDALSKQCRVITFSLADEPTSGASFDESAGVWSYVQQVSDVLDARGLREATICGISYRWIDRRRLRRAAYRPCLRADPDVGHPTVVEA